ncbi:class I SAM-dependent methyltransferase [Gilvimarinus sp. F26214L]|uniref:class I SAM-dependent methyltransferase n=1 Tax=Gilvimarinus sp. DZF01 TaxID=3461371 RepID=UPI0040452958
MTDRAPNRLLDLEELTSPDFAAVLDELDTLTERESISYLHPGKRWEYPWALSRAQLEPGCRVLDAGCGASIFPVYLAKNGYSVTALDLHPPEGLNEAHQVPVDYCRGELTELPFPDGSFDRVFCISVIEHLGHEGAPAALAELRRVLRPGGRLLITTDYYDDAEAEIFYEKDGERFPVDWGFYDARLLEHYLLDVPGLRLDGALDLSVDWDETRPRMREFHGYPYTSVGLAFVREV